MERSAIVPHISWTGPQPEKETDAYLLAMLLRIYAGLDDDEDKSRNEMQHPSVLTTENLHSIAIMYAFYRERMEEQGVRNTESMLRLIKAMEDERVADWLPSGKQAITAAENELIEYVETPGHKGFTAFG